MSHFIRKIGGSLRLKYCRSLTLTLEMNNPLKNRENHWRKEEFAKRFHGMGTLAFARQLIYPSALHYMGDVKGKKVLDIGCGEGEFCSLIKSKGASKVVGVDISPFLLEHARKQDPTIEYRQRNIYDLKVIDRFDFVTSNRVIHYEETEAGLVAMCRDFYNNLKDGGLLVATIINCFEDLHYGNKLKALKLFNMERLPPTNEAKRYQVVLKGTTSAPVKVNVFSFEPIVYEEAFKEVGFKKFSFKPAIIDKSIEQAKGFWDVIEKKPLIICIVAEK